MSCGEVSSERVTLLLLGVTCSAIGYLAADVWLTPDRRWSPFDVGQRDRATLALAAATVYGALHLLA